MLTFSVNLRPQYTVYSLFIIINKLDITFNVFNQSVGNISVL